MQTELSKGKAYYIVMFADANLTVPVIQTLIYEQAVDRGDGSRHHLFRELRSSGETVKFSVDEEHVEDLLLGESDLLAKLAGAFQGDLSRPGH